MGRRKLGPRLYLDPGRRQWVIRDGNVFIRTGYGEDEEEGAKRKFTEYLTNGNEEPEGERVYFVRFGDRVKIGRARDVRVRLAALQAMSPVPLRLLWSQSGGAKTELYFHHKFKNCRAHGEWFEIRDELRTFLVGLGVRP